MGGLSTKEEIIARLDALDREEININKQLRDLQIELNGIVPVKDRVKVKTEYFDNISIADLEKHHDGNNEEDIENENLEDLEEDDDDSKRKKKKKKKVEKEVKKEKKTTKKKSKKNNK